jgi:type VI protein secretion system component VasK
MPASKLKSLAKLVVLLLSVAVVVVLVMEWRAGTAFERHRNWRAQSVSNAEALIVGAIILLGFIVGGVWSWWDRRRDERLLKEISKGKGRRSRS